MEILRRAAERLLACPFEVWRTGDAVALEGLLGVSRLTGELRWRAWVHGMLSAWCARSQPFRESDDTAAGRALCMLFEETGDDAILEGALQLAGYLLSRRTINGACIFREAAPLRRPYGDAALSAEDEELLGDPGPCVLMNWLQMPLGFLIYLGSLTGRRDLVEFAAEQALAQLAVLQDDSGLIWHFWLEKTGRRYGLGWGRGQAWSLLGLIDLLEWFPHDDMRRDRISEATRRLAEALREHQLPDGGWRSVVVDDASPVESSTACYAVAAYRRGVELGILEAAFEEAATRAWSHILDKVTADGVMHGVSGNIGASTVESHYSNAPLDLVVPWGQGALLLAVAALGEASVEA